MKNYYINRMYESNASNFQFLPCMFFKYFYPIMKNYYINVCIRNYVPSYPFLIYIYAGRSNRLVFANNRRDREWRKRQQVHVGAYVKRRNVLERFVARFDGACRGVAGWHGGPAERRRARVDQFQSKAGCHSSRLDYSARIFVSRLVSSLNLCARRSLLRALLLLVLSVNSPSNTPRLSLSAARSSSSSSSSS